MLLGIPCSLHPTHERGSALAEGDPAVVRDAVGSFPPGSLHRESQWPVGNGLLLFATITGAVFWTSCLHPWAPLPVHCHTRGNHLSIPLQFFWGHKLSLYLSQ